MERVEPPMTSGEVGRLADEGIRLSLWLAENTALLAVAAQYAWMTAWVDAFRQAEAAVRASVERQACTDRLIRRGVPLEAAAQGLRLL